MHAGKKVVAFTPYGRERTVSVLYPYLKREHDIGVLDEWMLCMNTNSVGQEGDIEYAHKLAEENDWIKLYNRPGDPGWADGLENPPEIPSEWNLGPRAPVQMNTGRFYVYMVDRDTIYLRFDDDIIYVHPEAVRRLVEAKVSRPGNIACFPVIITNAVSSWYMQKHGHIPLSYGLSPNSCTPPVGWGSAEFAVRLHDLMLEHLFHRYRKISEAVAQGLPTKGVA